MSIGVEQNRCSLNGRRLKVLVAAYACDPSRGSEMAVGWSWVTAIARNHEVWVITADWQRENIERFIACSGETSANLHFEFVTPKPWHYNDVKWFWRACERSTLKPLMHCAYTIWQREAFRLACELNEKVQFDLAHQLTFVGFRFPGRLWKLEIPFVWGPIGGLENVPWQLLPSMGFRGAFYYGARNVVNFAHKTLLRGPRRALRRADAAIAATSSIQAEISRWYSVPSEVICEVGLPFEPAVELTRRGPREPLKLAWSGRHLPGKALQLLLRALHAVHDCVDWRLEIWGDGPCRSSWQKLASRLGISARCTWRGEVPRDEALRGLRRAHVFVITSLKDLTSSVTIEALAQGVPVICPDHCGFSDVITDECGIKLPIHSTSEFERRLAGSVPELAFDEEWRLRLAAGALRRARAYSLETRAETIERLYRAALQHHHARINGDDVSRDRSILVKSDAAFDRL
jgi:glycosyltransferase involved in cell wall biosynthesis